MKKRVDPMTPISSFIGRAITPTDKKRKAAETTELTSSILPGNRIAAPFTYEDEVFRFLFANSAALGIQSVVMFKNLVVDGQIVLLDGRRFVIEIKLRMNWLKACQANYQFRSFLGTTNEAKLRPVDGAIVFFKGFSGDWAKQSKKARNAWGWEAWYLNHAVVEGEPIELLRFSDDKLIGYPSDDDARESTEQES
jgi:hypothetical protein